jgi:hypothetical protein
MYPSLHPRLGVLHFTLAMIFVPFGAPQAGSVPNRVRPAVVAAPPVSRPAIAGVSRVIGPCIARGR